eukprot:1136146-Pelagomonas_calceolata.AAC.4
MSLTCPHPVIRDLDAAYNQLTKCGKPENLALYTTTVFPVASGASLESLPTSLHHLSQKMAQAVSGSAGGGGMMSQLVQDLARKALLQPTSSPASLQEIQGSRALSQAQLAQDAKEAEQHSLPERLLRLEETMAAIAAAVQRIEGGQHSILQGQQVILSRLERLEHTSVGDVFEK